MDREICIFIGKPFLFSLTQYERLYIPPQAIKTMSRRAADGYQGSSQYHATASNGDWSTCECCWRACNRQPDVGIRKRHRLQLQSGAQLSAQARGRDEFSSCSLHDSAPCCELNICSFWCRNPLQAAPSRPSAKVLPPESNPWQQKCSCFARTTTLRLAIAGLLVL